MQPSFADALASKMDSHSRILLTEANQLVNATRRRIELTSTLLGMNARANELPEPRPLRASGRGAHALEHGKRQLSPAGRIDPGVQAELDALDDARP